MPPVTPMPTPTAGAVAASVVSSSAINWPALWGIVIGLASILMAVIGISLLAKSQKGRVKEAGHTSAVAGIGLAWIAAAVLGAGVAISLVTGLFDTLTGR